MIISKKKFEEAIKRAKEECYKQFEEERCRRDNERWEDEKFREVWKELSRLNDEVVILRGIKDKYDKVCEAVTSAPTYRF